MKNPITTANTDRGWAWVVVLGAFLSHYLTCGFEKGYSVLYAEIVTRYNVSAALASGLGGFSAAIRLLFGFGLTLVYTPSLTICTTYFKERRATAISLSLSGCGFSALTMPYLIVFLIDQYAFHGSLLILAAISLHYSLAGSLFRDYEKYEEKPIEKPNWETTTPNVKMTLSKRFRKFFKERIHPKSWVPNNRNPWFLLFLSSFCFNMMGSGPVTTLLIHHSENLGYRRILSVQLLAIEGVTQIFVRIITGIIFDHPRIKPIRGLIWSMTIALSALVIFFLAFAQTLWLMSLLMFLRGITLAVYISQQAVMAADMCAHTPDQLKQTIGLTQIGKGVGVLLGSWIAGVIRDTTDDYTLAFIFLSLMQFIGSIFAGTAIFFSNRSANDDLTLELNSEATECSIGSENGSLDDLRLDQDDEQTDLPTAVLVAEKEDTSSFHSVKIGV